MQRAKNSVVLIGVIFLILVIPTIGGGYYFYRHLEDQLLNHVIDSRQALASLSAAAVSLRLNTLAELDTKYAADPVLSSDVASGAWRDGASRVETLLEDPAYYDYYMERVLLVDRAGVIQSAYPGVKASVIGTKDPAAEQWLKTIVQGGAASYVSNVRKNPAGTQDNVIEVTVPIKNGASIAGLASIVVPINEFSDFGKEITVDSTGFAYIVDGEGRIVAHPRYPSEGTIVDYSGVPSVQELLVNKSGIGINYNSIENQKRIVAYEKLPGFDWGVVAQEPYQDAMRARNSILMKTALLTVILSLLEAIFAWALAQIILRNYER